MGEFQHSNLEPFWGYWYIESEIGKGNFGTVYKIYQEDFFHNRTYSALKIIAIPKASTELKRLSYRGMNASSSAKYFREIAENMYGEINLMAQLKAKSNIVSYEDHNIIPMENGIGYYILIRMELLQSLNDYLLHNSFTDEDALSLAKDLCEALILCQKKDIIHRDIKPDNIFVTKDGDFKLGDFGIARKLEGAKNGLTIVGTDGYMAPEVIRGEAYDGRVDIYSLGMVIYYYLNNRKEPFCNTKTSVLNQNEFQESQSKRITGEKLPKPVFASDRFAEVILRACEYNPNDRYQTPEEFLNALNTLESSDLQKTVLVSPSDTLMIEPENTPTPVLIHPIHKNNKKNKLIAFMSGGAVLALCVIIGIFIFMKPKPLTTLSEPPEVTVTVTVIPEVESLGDEVSDNKHAEESEPDAEAVVPYELEFEANGFPGFEVIEDVDKLTSLVVTSNNLSSIDPLSTSLLLDYLNLQNNNIQSIEALSNMTRLTLLNASDNQIEDLSPLRKLTSLEVLILSNNKIRSIDELSDLTSLTTLQLDGNADLTSITALSGMENLQVLTLTNTGITDISPLYDMTSLTILDLTGTAIAEEQFIRLSQELPDCLITR